MQNRFDAHQPKPRPESYSTHLLQVNRQRNSGVSQTMQHICAKETRARLMQSTLCVVCPSYFLKHTRDAHTTFFCRVRFMEVRRGFNYCLSIFSRVQTWIIVPKWTKIMLVEPWTTERTCRKFDRKDGFGCFCASPSLSSTHLAAPARVISFHLLQPLGQVIESFRPSHVVDFFQVKIPQEKW